jgi:hypothetical protein
VTEERRSGERRRTLALHGRNPAVLSSLTPQSVAASNPCLNCGTNVQLEFCPECGQRAIDPDPTLREFLHELAGEFLRWDGKLITTFRTLVSRPGVLTNEYLAGRRVRYISPPRVYLVCSVLYFFVSALAPQPQLVTNQGPIVTTRLAAAIPKAMFVLVPLFAALVMVAFRQSRRRFPQHLAFALHVHAFLFLVLTLMLVRRLTDVVPIQVGVTLLGIAAILVYLVRSMRAVYDVSLGSAVARSALVGITYALAFGVATLLTFELIVLLQF